MVRFAWNIGRMDAQANIAKSYVVAVVISMRDRSCPLAQHPFSLSFFVFVFPL